MRISKPINSLYPCISQNTNLTNNKIVKKESSVQLLGYKVLEDIQIKLVNRKTPGRFLRV